MTYGLQATTFLIIGDPGVGKTTVLTKAANIIRTKGYTVGGMISRERRVKGDRVGFEIMDIATGRQGTLASSTLGSGPRVGRYRVSLQDLAEVGAKAMVNAVKHSDIILCDEIGPMELYSPEFRRAVREAMLAGKPVLAIVHKRLRDPLIEEIKSQPFTESFEVTFENRGRLPGELAERVLSSMKG